MIVKHPARYSTEILQEIGTTLKMLYPRGGVTIVDPNAGDGIGLRQLSVMTGLDIYGIEIEPEFILDTHVHVGDATEWSSYPPFDRWIAVTSPVYPSGMADAHQINDGSKRYSYTAALGHLPNERSMAAYGYRSTKRGGNSQKRKMYWELADAMVANWATAEMVVVNVSDFLAKRNGVVEREPLVADWCDLLARHGWTVQALVPVQTKRMKNGANRDQRVEHEVVIYAQRAPVELVD